MNTANNSAIIIDEVSNVDSKKKEKLLAEIDRKRKYLNMRNVCKDADVSYNSFTKKEEQGISDESVEKLISFIRGLAK